MCAICVGGKYFETCLRSFHNIQEEVKDYGAQGSFAMKPSSRELNGVAHEVAEKAVSVRKRNQKVCSEICIKCSDASSAYEAPLLPLPISFTCSRARRGHDDSTDGDYADSRKSFRIDSSRSKRLLLGCAVDGGGSTRKIYLNDLWESVSFPANHIFTSEYSLLSPIPKVVCK